MPKRAVFTLTGPHEGKTMVINDKYPFTEGVFRTQAVNGPLMGRILCQYYGAELTYEDSSEPEADPNAEEGSLSVSATRGQTEGEKMEASALAAKLEHARLQEEAEKAAAEKAATVAPKK